MKNRIKKILKNKVAKNTSWIIAERIIQMLISLVVGSLSARYLGPSNYGLINYGASIVALFTAITKLGLDSIIVKEYVDKKDENGNIIGTAMVMRTISSIISMILIFITVLILKPNDKLVQILTILQSISLLFQSYEILDLWFQSNLNSKYTSIAKSIAYIVVSVYKIFLLVTSKSVIWFAFSTTLDYILIFIILMIMYKKDNGQKLNFSINTSKDLIKKSYHFILSGLMVTLYMQMDKIMIGNMIDDVNVGLYSAATTICTLWAFIPEAIINSFRPTIYDLKKHNEEIYVKKLKLLYCIIFWLGITFCTFIAIFSKLIILILYGKNYLGAQITLIIAVWYTAFAYVGVARNIWIVSENKNKYAKKFTVIGAIVNLSFNIIFIPKFGINGAAFATLLSQISVLIIAPLFYKETRVSTKYVIDAMLFKGLK